MQESDQDYAARRLASLVSEERMLTFERDSVATSVKTMEETIQKAEKQFEDIEKKLTANKSRQLMFKEDLLNWQSIYKIAR